jgi:starch phosphorylase
MFKQMIFDGWQTEIPDPWLKNGFPWGITRTDVKYPVRIYGQVEGVPIHSINKN